MSTESPFDREPTQLYVTGKLKELRERLRDKSRQPSKLGRLYLRQDGRCCYCKKRMWLEDWKEGEDWLFLATKEHVMPRALGGGNNNGNIWAACRQCNKDKSNMSPADWFKKLRAMEMASCEGD